MTAPVADLSHGRALRALRAFQPLPAFPRRGATQTIWAPCGLLSEGDADALVERGYALVVRDIPTGLPEPKRQRLLALTSVGRAVRDQLPPIPQARP